MGNHPLPGYGSVTSGDRLVRTRLLGGVGAGGEIPPATRLAFLSIHGEVRELLAVERLRDERMPTEHAIIVIEGIN
jgi:hypothetical protein